MNPLISFRPTEEEAAFYEVARNFARDHIRPAAHDAELNRQVPDELASKAIELGFTALELPESLDGLDLPLIAQVQVMEGLTWGDLDIVQGLPGTGPAASILRFTAEHAAVQAYASLGGDGNFPTAAFLDASHVDVAWNEGITLTKSGTGYVLRGLSRPIRSALTACFLAVAARDEDGNPVVLWIDKETTPWQVQEGDIRLGLLAAGIGRIQFDGLEVGADRVLAIGSAAADLLNQALPRIRVLEAAKQVGLMQAALEYAITYTAGRKAFGQEIAKFQGVSFVVADMAIEKQAAHHLVWQAATLIDANQSEGEAASLQALARAHRAVRFITDNAVQLLGGHGFVKEFPVEKWMRDAQAQVMLYGREAELLADRGKLLLPTAGGN